MNKKLSFTLAVFFAALLAFIINHQKYSIGNTSLYTAILSTDGNIVPGKRQDFLISLFKDTDNNRIFESKVRIALKINYQTTNEEKKEEIIHLVCNRPGKYFGTFIFPENIPETIVETSVFIEREKNTPILTCKIPVKKETTIIVQPPKTQCYIGDTITFKLASVDQKSGLSKFKIPIRVRLVPPSGYTTLNRVITTGLDGLANFETRIHPASPEGYYNFIFSYNNFTQKISLYIKHNDNKEIYNHIPTYSHFSNNENSGFIYNLICEETNALLAYGCPESEHRQIEIWQNGKLHYYSDLALEGGTISLVFDKSNPLLSGCPTLFKIWQLKDNHVLSHEKVRYLPFNNPNEIGQFLKEVNYEFQNTEKDKLALSFSRKGFIGATNKISIDNLTQTYSLDLKNIYPTPKNEISISYYENLLNNTSEEVTNFCLVDKEINIKDLKKCKIFLNTVNFLNSYLEVLSKKTNTLENLLQESICRCDIFPYLDIPSQNKEKQEIEGLLIPISEIYNYLNKYQNERKNNVLSIISSVNKIRNITFIPAEFTFDIEKNKNNLTSIPMLDINPVKRSLQSIQGLLRPTGQVLLKSQNSSKQIELNKSEIIISSENFDKIINLRPTPLIIQTN